MGGEQRGACVDGALVQRERFLWPAQGAERVRGMGQCLGKFGLEREGALTMRVRLRRPMNGEKRHGQIRQRLGAHRVDRDGLGQPERGLRVPSALQVDDSEEVQCMKVARPVRQQLPAQGFCLHQPPRLYQAERPARLIGKRCLDGASTGSTCTRAPPTRHVPHFSR